MNPAGSGRPIFPRNWENALKGGMAVVVEIKTPGPSAQALAAAWRKIEKRKPLALLESQGPGKRFSLLAGEPLFSFEGRAERSWISLGGRKKSLGDHPATGLRRIAESLVAGGIMAEKNALSPLIGWLSYEAGRSFESLPQASPEPVGAPDWMFFLPGQWAWLEPATGQWRFCCLLTGRTWKENLCRDLGVSFHSGVRSIKPATRIKQWAWNVGRLLGTGEPAAVAGNSPIQKKIESKAAGKRYQKSVTRVKRYICAGDVFQVNLSHRMSCRWQGDAFELYRHLSAINPSPYGSFVEAAGLQLISASPERLFRQRGNMVDSFPIAGTRPRSASPARDKALQKELHTSPKERAEHTMLVDLERNDLGRVCRAGSVQVTDFMIHERYSHVQHIVSRVKGKLKAGLEILDVLAAGFPGGTITGAPKIRCMEIITELEKEARGLYTGSLGYWDPWHRKADFNILIRSIILKNKRAYCQVGAGIVADSNPAREWRETLHKAEAMIQALAQV